MQFSLFEIVNKSRPLTRWQTFIRWLQKIADGFIK